MFISKSGTGKLRSLVIVENLWPRPLKHLLKRFETKRGFQGDRRASGKHTATEPVHDRHHGQKAASHANVSNVGALDLIGSLMLSPRSKYG